MYQITVTFEEPHLPSRHKDWTDALVKAFRGAVRKAVESGMSESGSITETWTGFVIGGIEVQRISEGQTEQEGSAEPCTG